MPSEPRITKHSERQKLLSAVAAVTIISIHGILLPFLNKSLPQLMRNSRLSGREYTAEVLTSDNPKRCQEVFRMKREVFQYLCSELQTKGGLYSSKHIAIDEKLGMFLWTVARAASNRDVQERFQHSGETVSRHFHEVLNAVNVLVPEYIRLPSASDMSVNITSNAKFYSYFNDCIGALDGTHIAAKVSKEDTAAYRNRKGWLSQNVLACCEFDNSLFTYVLADWEGSAHDGAVLEAAFDAGFKVPTGKYYLTDAGYALTPWCITPYRGVRYHLHEWDKANLR